VKNVSSDFFGYGHVNYVVVKSKISVIMKQSTAKYVSVCTADSDFVHRTCLPRTLKIMKSIFSKIVIY